VADTTVQLIPVGELRLDGHQPRGGYGPVAELETLKRSMAQLGRTVQYVTVCPGPEGAFRVISGHRRVQAAIELGWDWLPAVVVDQAPDEVDRLLRQIAENCARSGLRPPELCDAIGRLRDRVEPPDIAAATGVSIRTVYNYLALLDHPDLVEELRSGRSLRRVLADVAARRQELQPTPLDRRSLRRLRSSARQLLESWPRLEPEERRRLAAMLRPLLEDG
jgi:ParB/RepB/Spo0J family partition protein